MKNWKRITAIGMAAAMTWGGSLTVLADTTSDITAAQAKSGQTVTGTGTADSTVIDMKKYEVVLPTAAAITNALSYTVDPQGLVEATAAAAYGTDIEIGENNGVFFANKNDDGTATVAVSGASDVLTITNKSTSGVSIEVKTQLTEAASDKYAGGYSTTQDFSGTGDDAKGLFLGVLGDGEFVRAIDKTGSDYVTFTNVVLSAADLYELKYESNAYAYTLPADATGLPTYGLQFVGAINPDVADTTWATYETSTTTNIDQLKKVLELPTITLVFKPTFIDAKPAMAVLDGETLYLGKIDAGDEGGFGTTKPTAVTVNGKTISVIGNNVDGYATVTWAEIYKAFDYPTEDKIPDAEALYNSINAIQFTVNGIDYYAEIK